MTTFEKTDLNVSEMTQEQLDNIALNQAGIIGSIGFGYRTADNQIAPRHGYRFRWVNTRGMGNYGSLVMLPTNEHTARYLHEGQVKRLMDSLDMQYVEADRLIAAAESLRFGKELPVLEYAWGTRHYESWVQFDPGHIWRWFRQWEMPETALSAPRLETVAQIVCRLNR